MPQPRAFPINFPPLAFKRLGLPGITSDSTSPTVTITCSDTYITTGNPFSITITFSEIVIGFAVGDLTVGNGSASNLATGDNIVYTADITPTAFGVVTVDIAAGVCTDLAGNPNVAATQFSIFSLVGAAMVQIAGTQSYKDTGATLPAVADNDPVGFQNDQSANNNDLTRIVDDTRRAVLKLNILNSRPILRFTAASTHAYSFPNTIINAAGFYWWTVARLADNAASYPILSENDGTRRSVLYGTTTKFEVRYFTGAVYVNGNQTVNVDTNAHVFTFEHTGAAVNLYVDGVQGAGNGASIIDSTAQKRLGVGNGIGGGYFNGDWGASIAYIGAVSAGNRAALEAALGNMFLGP